MPPLDKKLLVHGLKTYYRTGGPDKKKKKTAFFVTHESKEKINKLSRCKV